MPHRPPPAARLDAAAAHAYVAAHTATRADQAAMLARIDANVEPCRTLTFDRTQQRNFRKRTETYYASGAYLARPLTAQQRTIAYGGPGAHARSDPQPHPRDAATLAAEWLSQVTPAAPGAYADVTLTEADYTHCQRVAQRRTEENANTKDRAEYRGNHHLPETVASLQAVLCERGGAVFLADHEPDPDVAAQYRNAYPVAWPRGEHNWHRYEADIGDHWEVRSLRWTTSVGGVKPKDLHLGRMLIVAQVVPEQTARGTYTTQRVEGVTCQTLSRTVRIRGIIPANVAWILGKIVPYNHINLTRGIPNNHLALDDFAAANQFLGR